MDAVVQASELEVRIGREQRRFRLYATRAPASYDGFGTMQVETDGEEGGERYVLIDEPHVEWQTRRYASGMYGYRPADELEGADLEERLMVRLYAEVAR